MTNVTRSDVRRGLAVLLEIEKYPSELAEWYHSQLSCDPQQGGAHGATAH
jgi:hypothetical protein